MDVGRIRGAAVRSFMLWYVSAHGTGRLERALGRLAAEDRRYFDGSPGLGIRAGEWYPARPIHQILDGLAEGLASHAVDDLARRGAHDVITADLNGLMGGLFRFFVSPAMCAAFAQSLWSAYFDSGRVSVDPIGVSAHRMRVCSWRSHHPFLCRLNVAAGVPIYSATGCNEVTTVLETCIERGDPCCTYSIRWR